MITILKLALEELKFANEISKMKEFINEEEMKNSNINEMQPSLNTKSGDILIKGNIRFWPLI